eukprot:Hpha_TRINITY_DN35751_c0_g1::TRINITY_DN35751_c0_g1_i1::g.139921::m.139921
MVLSCTKILLSSPRRIRMNFKHWDMLHELLQQDEDMGLSPEKTLKAPWPAIPPMDISTMEMEWRRYRNVRNLVANGTILPPRWFRMTRLVPPTSGPFWGDPPVQSVDHTFPLRRHFWTPNMKPPTELMKTFLLRKEDRVMESNYKRVIGFSPREKARQALKEEASEAAMSGRSTLNFFWQRKPLERMETRFWQLKEEGLSEGEARKAVTGEFYQTLARQKIMAAQAADGARLTGKAMSSHQAQCVLDLIQHAQKENLGRAEADPFKMRIREAVKDARKEHTDDDTDEAADRFLRVGGLSPNMTVGDLSSNSFSAAERPQSPLLDPMQAHRMVQDDSLGGGKPSLEERIGRVPNRGKDVN